MPKKRAPFERFQERYQVCEGTGCWLWTGQVRNGYGVIKVFGKMLGAHVLSHQLYHGHVKDGLEVLHACDVKRCVNPNHLRAATHAENMREAAARGLMPSGTSHPRSGKPTYRARQANVVRVLGKIYPSQNAAERELGLGSGTVRYWLHSAPSKAQIISKGELNA